MRYVLTMTNSNGPVFWTGPKGWTDDLNSKRVRTYEIQTNAMRSVSRHMFAEQDRGNLRDAAALIREISAAPLGAEYDVQADYGYGYGFETVTCEPTSMEAAARVKEYRANDPGVTFRIARVRTLAAAQ